MKKYRKKTSKNPDSDDYFSNCRRASLVGITMFARCLLRIFWIPAKKQQKKPWQP